MSSCHHLFSIAGSSFRSLSKIPHCWLQTKPGPCLSPSVADRPHRPTKDHRLGKLLPHQQPNPQQAHLIAKYSLSIIRNLSPNYKADSYLLRTRSLLIKFVQLACVKPTISVHPELGSNSLKGKKYFINHTFCKLSCLEYKNLNIHTFIF